MVLSLLAIAPVHGVAWAESIVAVAVPRSGPKANTGHAILQAAEASVSRVNAEGGLLGQPLRIVTFDDGCDSAKAAAAAQTISLARPVVVFGHPCGNAAVAAASVYTASDILLLAVGVRDAALTASQDRRNIFRVAGRDDKQGVATAHFLAERFREKNIAIVHDRTQFMRGLAKDVSDALHEMGGKVALSTTIVAASKDYTKLINQLKSDAIDVLYFAGFPPEAARILGQMAAADIDALLVGPDVLATTDFGSQLGDAASRVWLMRPAVYRSRDDAKMSACNYRRKDDRDWQVANAEILSCAAFESWIKAVQNAGSFEPSIVSPWLGSNTVNTVAGPLSFDSGGDALLASYDVVTWRKDLWRLAPAATAD